MKCIICGGREFKNTDFFFECMENQPFDVDMIVAGGAEGVDTMAELFAISINMDYMIFTAYWNDLTESPLVVKTSKSGVEYNALAGHNRNKRMLDYADCVIAIWDGKSTGTKHMIDITKKAKKPLKVFYY